ncbi:PRC-barrel domain-containing protein [Pseudonocardia bannensis]|uniref:PRC-barrel domain-containing protein n=1 Tax=Pseudonocardia bannensis TaxID=630973 RepID=A0A848DE42_9PSEU|nr:PRC-barrel domain-containing protein [Pseudonocardia bannensis]NMH90856.1 hypothetical protein [Pseudonocardia bannensis]
MTQPPEWAAYQGRPLYDQDDVVIGIIEDFYSDRDGGEAVWVLVVPGERGTAQSFVPLRDARARGADLQVSVSGHETRDAPTIQPGGELSGAEEQRLYQHYDMPYPAQDTPATGTPAGGTPAGGTTDTATGGPPAGDTAAAGAASEPGREPAGSGDQPQRHRPSLLRRLLGLDRDTSREEVAQPRQKVERTV